MFHSTSTSTSTSILEDSISGATLALRAAVRTAGWLPSQAGAFMVAYDRAVEDVRADLSTYSQALLQVAKALEAGVSVEDTTISMPASLANLGLMVEVAETVDPSDSPRTAVVEALLVADRAIREATAS